MLIDLHTHSTFSDGLLTVEQLVKKAKQKGIKFLALTDHDTVAGAGVFKKACARSNIRGIIGIEMSTELDGLELHILGYNLKTDYAPLKRLLKKQQEKRVARAKLILKKLGHIGLAFSPASVAHLLSQPTVGKPQLGRAVMQEKRNRAILKKLFNFESSLSDFIGKFLDKPGQIGYVHKKRIDTLSAIRIINKSSGQAVLAHPDLDFPSRTAAAKYLKLFKQAGLWGVEMPHHYIKEKKFYADLAHKLGLNITFGSDTHDGKKMGVAVPLRTLPFLPPAALGEVD